MPPPGDVEDGRVVHALTDVALSERVGAEVHDRRVVRIRERHCELYPRRGRLRPEVADAEHRRQVWIAWVVPDLVHVLGDPLYLETGPPPLSLSAVSTSMIGGWPARGPRSEGAG